MVSVSVRGVSVDHRWFRQGGGAVTRQHPDVLLCYPHGGAGAGAYVGWPRELGQRYDVLAVQPPGRHDRSTERWPGSIRGLAAGLAAEIATLPARRVALFGHSFGAVVMLETAHTMVTAGLPEPAALIVSGHEPPPTDREPAVDRPWPDADLLALCKSHGADEVEQLCADPDVRDLILPPLRQDLRALDAHRPAERPPLGLPLLVLRGDGDPTTTPRTAAGWARHTTGPIESRTYVGGHFFVRSRRRDVTTTLDEYLAEA